MSAGGNPEERPPGASAGGRAGRGAILTLEPLVEAVRAGVEGSRWTLSGLQKTTSHEFEGRWEGDSTRSAYLFFHAGPDLDHVSVEAYLDETSRGLTGNLSLVVDLLPLGRLGHAAEALARLAEVSRAAMPDERRRPVTLRFHLADASTAAGEAEAVARFKVSIPKGAIAAGPAAVAAHAEVALAAFERVLASGLLRGLADVG